MKSFDDVIKSKLAKIDASFDTPNWDSMSERLDEMDADRTFDEHIKDGLKNAEFEYPKSNHAWDMMKSWLDFSEQAREKYLVSKGAEVTLMALTVICLFTGSWVYRFDHMPTSPSSYAQLDGQASVGETSTKTEANLYHQAEDGLSTYDAYEVRTTGGHPTEATPVKDNIPSPAKALTSSHLDPSSALSVKSRHDETTIKQLEKAEQGSLATASLLNDASTCERSSFDAVQSLPRANGLAVHSASTSKVLHHQLDEFRVMPQIQTIAMKTIDDVALAGIDLEAPTITPASKWRLSGLVSLDFNQIRTPFDAIYEKAGYSQHKIGQGGGMMIGRSIGKGFALNTGLLFSAKRYNPREFIELFRQNEFQEETTVFKFDRIELNLVSIPLHISKHYRLGKNWSVSVRAGASAQIATHAIYDTDFNVERLDIEQFTERNPNATVTFGDEARFEQKRFPDGLFGSGDLRDNLYVSLDIGLGLERKIGEHGALFLQPTMFYNAFNKGLSANNDKIHVYSLQFGYAMNI